MKTCLAFAIGTILSTGCASTMKGKATGFAPKSNSPYGYSIQGDESEPTALMAIFEGNSLTPPTLAKAYSILAAIDYCQKKSSNTQFLGPSVDFTEESHTTKIGAYSVPSGYMGNPDAPSIPLVYSYPVKIMLPKVATPFRCGKKFPFVASDHDLEPLSRELVHPIVKDFHGGVMIRANDDNQIKARGLAAGDVILSVGGKRVESLFQLSQALGQSDKNPVPAKVLREGKVQGIDLKFTDAIDRVRTAESKLLSESCTIVAENQQSVQACLK